ncbi:hypothetical protein ACYOEI_17260 [Singulisphaera rosea]
MTLTCKTCGGRVKPKTKKVATVLGGTAMVMAAGAVMGVSTGWLALLAAAWSGSRDATKIIHMKIKLMQESQKLGSYFVCSGCGRDVDILEVLK